MNNTKKENDNSSRFILLSIIFVTILIIAVIALSFSAFIKLQKDGDSNSISTGNISMTYTENTNGISIENALPMSDAVGKKLSDSNEYFDFTITSDIVGDVAVDYEIAAIKDSSSNIPDYDVKLYLEKQVSGTYEEFVAPTSFIPITSQSDIGSPVGSMILKKITKKQSGNDNYRLRMWLNESAAVDAGKIYKVKINVYGKAL